MDVAPTAMWQAIILVESEVGLFRVARRRVHIVYGFDSDRDSGAGQSVCLDNHIFFLCLGFSLVQRTEWSVKTAVSVCEGSIGRACSCLANRVVFLAPRGVTLLKEMEEQENLEDQEPWKKHLDHQHGSGDFGL